MNSRSSHWRLQATPLVKNDTKEFPKMQRKILDKAPRSCSRVRGVLRQTWGIATVSRGDLQVTKLQNNPSTQEWRITFVGALQGTNVEQVAVDTSQLQAMGTITPIEATDTEGGIQNEVQLVELQNAQGGRSGWRSPDKPRAFCRMERRPGILRRRSSPCPRSTTWWYRARRVGRGRSSSDAPRPKGTCPDWTEMLRD